MDYETSFDEYNNTAAATRFIALEVSDNDDDYNSSVDSMHGIEPSPVASLPQPQPQPQPPQIQVKVPIREKSVKKSEKRWSFMSNSSSHKKRWSTLSFTSDNISLKSSSASSKKNKRVSNASLQSTNSNSKSHKTEFSNSSLQSLTKSPSLKRSSTGASLRQLFGKIALNDEDKENHGFDKETSPHQSSKFRTPLQPLNPSTRNVLKNHNTNTMVDRRKSLLLSPSMDNISIASQSSVSSASSRWKFWKSFKNNSNDAFNDASSIQSKSSFGDLRRSIFMGDLPHRGNQNMNASPDANHRRTQSTLTSTLKHKSSHNSLKHKNSHHSLKRLKSRRNSSAVSEETQISLPVPDQVSREKIRNKLRHSTSLMSINSNVVGTPVIAEHSEYDQSLLHQLLHLCNSYETIPLGDAVSQDLKKISQYVYTPLNNGSSDLVYKIIPLGNDEFDQNKRTLSMCLQELKFLKLLNGTPGFTSLLSAYICTTEEGTKSDESEENMLLVLKLKNHGIPLSQLTLKSATQASQIFWQCVTILYVAEEKFRFEHRDLNLDNVLIDSQGNVTLIDYRLCRAQTNENIVMYTRLDHPLFFQGRGNYQFEIYNQMRQEMTSRDASGSPDCWSHFCARNNLFWCHYLCRKLGAKLSNVTPPRNRAELESREELQRLSYILDPTKRKRGLFKRNGSIEQLENCGDLLKLKEH